MFIFLIICSVFYRCHNDSNTDVDKVFDPEVIPRIITYNDTVLYSDSGRIQMKVIAAEIQIFEGSKDPHTVFPRKVYLEQYDSVMNITTKLWADTVWNFSRKKLWKLRGNVLIDKSDGKRYQGDELFWDETNDRVYSNELVEIDLPETGIIRGTQFESNQAFSSYTFDKIKGSEFYVKDEKEKQEGEK